MESGAEESSWFGLILTIGIFTGIWYGTAAVIDISEISRNWPKYRCSPSVIPFASLYGYDTSQNFNYCLKAIFEGQIGGVTGPFSTILGTITSSLMTFLKNLNSMRIMISTLVGGISKVLQEFADRFKLLFSQIKFTFLKLQLLMRRLFGTFFSVIYMGLSAVQVGDNFSKTFIFKFLDTFCFSPKTIITVKGKGGIQIQDVLLGDVLENDSVVMSVYKFIADGQPMVYLNGVVVSTNHYVRFRGNFIEAKDHPDSQEVDPWHGGVSKPLICLDTNTHTIPIDNYVFSDWDETNEIDEELMRDNELVLNGSITEYSRYWIFQPALLDTTEIIYKDGSKKKCNEVVLGDKLSTGTVIGIGKRLIHNWTKLPSGEVVTPSTLYWSTNSWIRAGKDSKVYTFDNSRIFYTFAVLGTATIELSSGNFVRDMCEVHSPDTEEVVHRHFRQVPEL